MANWLQCEDCSGRGFYRHRTGRFMDCDTCNGTGTVATGVFVRCEDCGEHTVLPPAQIRKRCRTCEEVARARRRNQTPVIDRVRYPTPEQRGATGGRRDRPYEVFCRFCSARTWSWSTRIRPPTRLSPEPDEATVNEPREIEPEPPHDPGPPPVPDEPSHNGPWIEI